MVAKQDVTDEMERAVDVLKGAVGDELPTVTVSSADPEEAVFLGQNISKLSPIIGNQIERRIPQLLQGVDTGHGLTWKRQDPDFPDAALFDRSGSPVGAGFEVKAWYPMATEVTGRFRESRNLLAGKDIRMVVVAWMMSHIVYGTPTIVGVLVADAMGVAKARDEHYHKPPDYLCDEPQNTEDRTRNLQQTNVLGFKLQETDPTRKANVQRIYQVSLHRNAPSHTPEAQQLVRQLLEAGTYRQDSNFAKIDRIDHAGVEAFKSEVLSKKFRGKQIKEWVKILRALNNDDKPAEQKRAAAVIEELYADREL